MGNEHSEDHAHPDQQHEQDHHHQHITPQEAPADPIQPKPPMQERDVMARITCDNDDDDDDNAGVQGVLPLTADWSAEPAARVEQQLVSNQSVSVQAQPVTTAAATAATVTAAAAAANPPTAPSQPPQQVEPVEPAEQQLVSVQGADGKQYLVPRGPPGTVPMVVLPQAQPKPKPQPKPRRKRFKSWRIEVVPTSARARSMVSTQQYARTAIVIGIVCAGDKLEGGYNAYGGYGAYGRSAYGDLDRKKFITMKVTVRDQLSIQHNVDRHYLEFWKNGVMFRKVIALDPHKVFQIRVGSTNQDYDVKLT